MEQKLKFPTRSTFIFILSDPAKSSLLVSSSSIRIIKNTVDGGSRNEWKISLAHPPSRGEEEEVHIIGKLLLASFSHSFHFIHLFIRGFAPTTSASWLGPQGLATSLGKESPPSLVATRTLTDYLPLFSVCVPVYLVLISKAILSHLFNLNEKEVIYSVSSWFGGSFWIGTSTDREKHRQ